MKKRGIYIHVPFCRSKCPYCDFYSIPDHDDELRARYTDAVCKEIEYYGIRCNDKKIESIYFGGGTPTILLSEQFAEIMDCIRNYFQLTHKAEVSMECNPGAASVDRLRGYKKAGLNRLSIGAQSFDNNVLKILGRIHNRKDIIRAVDMARKAGLRNISLDLMFGISGQTFTSWIESVQQAIELNPKHISLYSLEIMENTRFGEDALSGIYHETKPEDDRLMYEYALKILDEAGFHQYEISNVAKSRQECVHNLRYWNMGEYLGFGPSAHSFMENVLYSNIADVRKYVDAMDQLDLGKDVFLGTTNALGTGAVDSFVKNAYRDNVSEYMFTGLRKNQGISKKDFHRRFGKDLWDIYRKEKEAFQDFVDTGAAEEDELGIRLTVKGMNISNQIMTLFV